MADRSRRPIAQALEAGDRRSRGVRASCGVDRAQREGQGAGARSASRFPQGRGARCCPEGDDLHRVPPHPGVPRCASLRQRVRRKGSCCSTARTADDRSKAIYAEWIERHEGTDRSGVRSPRTCGRRWWTTSARGPDHDRDRGRRRRNQPPVLLAGRELRPALESAAHRAAHRPLPPLRPEARRGGRELPNRKNEADQRVYELLAEKFRLFEGVFGASDEVLGAIESGVDFEKRIAGIYQQCRKPEEIQRRVRSVAVGAHRSRSTRRCSRRGRSCWSGSTTRCGRS